ncbi:MAG TPA: FmdB family zinc ribbon protein [Candidatus Limnocylindrales bacterium]|nr:FmdB family zinc ribbon protein [Candidatus Limnocylindrales bacterium]
MPIYEYVCKKCHHRFEKIQKFSDRKIKKCPECGGPVEQAIHAPAVQFKGSGWYVTDYAKKGGESKEGSADKSDKKDSGTSKEAASAGKESAGKESTSKEKSGSDDKGKKSHSKKHD